MFPYSAYTAGFGATDRTQTNLYAVSFVIRVSRAQVLDYNVRCFPA
jgi:hypothetical protein